MTTKFVAQQDFRFRNDDGSETAATWKAAQGTSVTLETGTANRFRIRIILEETNGKNSNTTFDLYYSLNGGAYTDISTSSSVIRAISSANDGWTITDNDATTKQLTFTGTFVAGRYDDNGGTETNVQINGQYTEMEYSIYILDADVSNNDTIDFRVYAGGSAVEGYNATPRVTVSQAVGYTLTANLGSYTLTGTSANLEAGYKLTAASGLFTLTGTSADFVKGYTLAADAGIYAVTGTDAELIKTSALTLVVDPGSYAVTGTAAELQQGYVLSAESGTYSVLGDEADILHGYVINADTGAYSVNGTDASLQRGYLLDADVGQYEITGTNTELLTGYQMPVVDGEYSLTGTDANLIITAPGAYTIIADGGTYAVTGEDASLLANYAMPVDGVDYAITATDVNFLLGHVTQTDVGHYLIVGADVTFSHVSIDTKYTKKISYTANVYNTITDEFVVMQSQQHEVLASSNIAEDVIVSELISEPAEAAEIIRQEVRPLSYDIHWR